MAQRATTELTAQERVILFCAATGISHVAIGKNWKQGRQKDLAGDISRRRSRSARTMEGNVPDLGVVP